MSNLKPYFSIILLAFLFALASCAPTTPIETGANNSSEESHGDEHGDEDHGDEHGDEEHGDEHGDEDHGDEHGDEDHDDEHGDEDHREHGAHEHGSAELSIALIDGQAEIMLETPAFNLVGFEYAPKTDEEKAAVDSATESLEKGEWFTLSEAAGCSLDAVDVDSTMSEESHEGEEHHDDEEGHEEEHGDEHGDEDHDGEKETHSSFFATYTFNCTSLENLNSFDATALFASFSNFEEIDAQWLDDTQQSAATLSKDQSILSFE